MEVPHTYQFEVLVFEILLCITSSEGEMCLLSSHFCAVLDLNLLEIALVFILTLSTFVQIHGFYSALSNWSTLWGK